MVDCFSLSARDKTNTTNQPTNEPTNEPNHVFFLLQHIMNGSRSIDHVINNQWFELYESYSKENNLTIDESIKPPQSSSLSSLSNNQLQSSPEINVGVEIPHLQQLIDNQPNSEQLSAELKSLLLKYYWSGFDLGYETDKR